eukprot:Amastigsp_a1773_84.p3 type:complete len:144 gc:universal Amastigsp_a1773_84:434-3(-)
MRGSLGRPAARVQLPCRGRACPQPRARRCGVSPRRAQEHKRRALDGRGARRLRPPPGALARGPCLQRPASALGHQAPMVVACSAPGPRATERREAAESQEGRQEGRHAHRMRRRCGDLFAASSPAFLIASPEPSRLETAVNAL